MKYMIHACPARLRYVEDHLFPSLIRQGADPEDVRVWNDGTGLGNLLSFVESCRVCGEEHGGGTWHLQDDVVLSRRFFERTEQLGGNKVICGFCFPVNDPCVNFRGENVPVKFLWYSFQCIYIPNGLAGEFADWFLNEARYWPKYSEKVADRRHDDWFFREFLLDRHPEARADHLTPNLVDHVDYLIGGTVINRLRSRKINRAVYWEEDGSVEELAAELRAGPRT